MAEIELGVDPSLPRAFADALRGHLAKRWPDISWRPVRLPAPSRDARDGSLLAVLARDATPPAGDPGELAVVRCDAARDGSPSAALLVQLDLEVARIDTERSGQGPQREVSPPPREMTRRALLHLPLPLGRPLPPVPWLEAELCLHQKGCDHCQTACTQGAVSFSRGTAAIRPDLCTGCGACVAACPTGALTSAHLSDSQWQAGLDVWAGAPGPIALRCLRTPDGSLGDVPTLPVGCVAEIGIHHLATAVARVGRLPELPCMDEGCPLRPQAGEALRQRNLMQGLQRDPDAPGVEAALPSTATSRGERLAQALRRLRPVPGGSAPDAASPGVGFTVCVREGGGQCTLCGGCVHTCPTHALAIEDGPDAGVLRLDAALCAGCSACAEACPEGVLEVGRAGLADLIAPQELVREAKAHCRGCGAAYETPSFVAALRERMQAAGFNGVLVERLDYCPDCRAALPR